MHINGRNNQDQEGVFLPMTGELKEKLLDLRRHSQLSGKGNPGDDSSLVLQLIEREHAEMMQDLGYPSQNSARSNSINSINRGGLTETAEAAKIRGAFGLSQKDLALWGPS